MQTVIYRSLKKLECQCDTEVIICIGVDLTASGAPFIEGTLLTTTTTTDTCLRTVYNYSLEYDENDLLDPTHVLMSSEVNGVLCKGCLTDYIETVLINAVPSLAGICFVSNDAEFVAAIASPTCNHIVTYSDFAIGGNRTVPDTKALTCLKNSEIITNGFLLTINGEFITSPYFCFDTSAGEVVFGDASVDFVYPQWFGAQGDNATDDTAALQLAIDSMSVSNDGQVKLLPGIYRNTGIYLPANVSLVGVSAQNCVLRFTPVTGNGITLSDSGLASGSNYCSIVDIKIDALSTSDGAAIAGPPEPFDTTDIYVDRYVIEGFLTGIYIPYGAHVYIGFGRLVGQGMATVGGIGVQLGDRSLGTPRLVTAAEVEGAYANDYETAFLCDCSVCFLSHVTSANAEYAVQYGGRVSVVGSWLQANTQFVVSAYNYTIAFFNCYFLDGLSVEVDDIVGMINVLDVNNVSVYESGGPKNPGMFRIRTAYSQVRSVEFGVLGANPVHMWNESGTLRVNSDTLTPLEVNMDGVPGAYTALFNLRRGGNMLAALGHDADSQACLLRSTVDLAAATWNDDLDFAAGEGLVDVTATNGFLWVPTCAGVPTGVPAPTGHISQFAPIVVDTTNDRLYYYTGGQWRYACVCPNPSPSSSPSASPSESPSSSPSSSPSESPSASPSSSPSESPSSSPSSSPSA